MTNDKCVTVNGSVAVVWYVSNDTTPEAPKRVLDLNTESDLIDNFDIEVNVEGKDMWVLDVNNGVRLTRFLADGSEASIAVPGEDLAEAFMPRDDTPANVWARAVSEAHECSGYQGDCCRNDRKKLAESGLLR
jgi:hypothetical protein